MGAAANGDRLRLSPERNDPTIPRTSTNWKLRAASSLLHSPTMILTNVYIRFYRAFNFDYLRARHPDARPDPWDRMEDERFYPYIQLGIDRDLTCVVGANESGKSQVLDAIAMAINNEAPSPADFCRYSNQFTVARAMKRPHLGLHFTELTARESDHIGELTGQKDDSSFDEFRVFYDSPGSATIYLLDGQSHAVSELDSLKDILPTILHIEADRPLPNSVPISFLCEGGAQADTSDAIRRHDRWVIHDSIAESAQELLSQTTNESGFIQTVKKILDPVSKLGRLSESEREAHLSRTRLARDLLVTVGGIDPSAFSELNAALRNDDEGLANGIEAAMNAQLEKSLDLAKWWSQDELFRLAVSVRDYDLVFTVRDRTGSEYSFAERSSGLKYFLSYLVQLLAHLKTRQGSDILLMDEPDAYLSNQGQQDLLRLLQEFTVSTDDRPGGQVVFVTHSPFLIDKNRADRLRVLDKGSGDEGARVVRNVGHNHFEPLRTALGGFVGETAFIGNCNLIVEGVADQIYLAGMSSQLHKRGFPSTQWFDLNQITLVPAGSASHIPYMTFLARGRDVDQPAVIVLLDSDDDGNIAATNLRRGGPRYRQLIKPEYVAQIASSKIADLESDRPGGPLDIEDLLPVEIAIKAAERYLQEMGIEVLDHAPDANDVRQTLSETTGVLQAVQSALEQMNIELKLEKIGFARHALLACEEDESESADEMRRRFGTLFTHLTSLQRSAERDRASQSIAARVDREIQRFLRDHTRVQPTKADLAVLLERIESVVDLGREGDALMTEIRRIRDYYSLGADLSGQITDMDDLKERLGRVKYAELLASQPEAQTVGTE